MTYRGPHGGAYRKAKPKRRRRGYQTNEHSEMHFAIVGTTTRMHGGLVGSPLCSPQSYYPVTLRWAEVNCRACVALSATR